MSAYAQAGVYWFGGTRDVRVVDRGLLVRLGLGDGRHGATVQYGATVSRFTGRTCMPTREPSLLA